MYVGLSRSSTPLHSTPPANTPCRPAQPPPPRGPTVSNSFLVLLSPCGSLDSTLGKKKKSDHQVQRRPTSGK